MISLTFVNGEWLARKGGDKYTSPEIQNELVTLCHAVLRVVATQLQQAEFFTLMTDEYVDHANKEQLAMFSICGQESISA